MKEKKTRTLTLTSEHDWDLFQFEMLVIFECLKAHNFSRTKTAKALGIALRTLRIKIGTMRAWGFVIIDYRPHYTLWVPGGKDNARKRAR